MTYLLDVNVLIALAWPNHTQHAAAIDWFVAKGKASWATCPSTQSSFVRISSNQRILADARTPQVAFQVLERLVALPGHTFICDDIALVSAPEIKRKSLLGHNQIADAHLLALAIRHEVKLATFDRGIQQLLRDRSQAGCIELIESRKHE